MGPFDTQKKHLRWVLVATATVIALNILAVLNGFWGDFGIPL